MMKLFLFGMATLLGRVTSSEESDTTLNSNVDQLRTVVASLARQELLTELEIEEKTRMEGDSGIRQLRHTGEGTKAYYSDSYINSHSADTIYDHADTIATLGMGEVAAVLNGVEFITRYNDYALRSPSRTSSDFKATTDITFPDVPPAVLSKDTVAEQIEEMKEWFRAFRDQNTTVRDYRDFFKPVLCYMEGMWTYASDNVDEPFESSSHFLDAETWLQLHDKVRYMAYSGSKDRNGNLAYLPRVVLNVTEDGLPVFAQWNYDILCHELNSDLPLNRFRVIDDLHARMRDRISLLQFASSRKARFQLNTADQAFTKESYERHKLLHTLMYQIPGKNNYGSVLRDFGKDDDVFRDADNPDMELNAAQYHRALFTTKKDAMGRQFRTRGFADENLYMAMTTQDKIAGISFTTCNRDTTCTTQHQKWTYTIPLEIIYMTPLSSWNPYAIPYRGANASSDEFKSVVAHGRTTGRQGSPYNGTNSNHYYTTPHEFYDASAGTEVDKDPADTTSPREVYVLDSEGIERAVRPSGHRVFIPEIEDVGVIRQRYPIAPIYASGNPIWKELEAVKDLVLDPLSNGHLIYNPTHGVGGSASGDDLLFNYRTARSNAKNQKHVHYLTLDADDIRALRDLQNVTMTSEQANGHVHVFVLYAESGLIYRLRYHTCDDMSGCRDGHKPSFVEVSETTA